jgi:hypothetical protein
MMSEPQTGVMDRLHRFLSSGVWQVDLAAAPRWQRSWSCLVRLGPTVTGADQRLEEVVLQALDQPVGGA